VAARARERRRGARGSGGATRPPSDGGGRGGAPPRRPGRRRPQTEPALAGRSYEHVRAVLHPGGGAPGDQDRLLAALVRLTRQDSDAVRLVVVCLRPGMAARVRRYQRGLGTEEAWAVLTAGLCAQIARYDTTRRPDFVARNLLWVPTRELQRAALACRETASRTLPLGTDQPCDWGDGPAFTARFLLGTAVQAGVLTERSARLLHAVRIADLPIRTAARSCGLGYEAAKKDLQRATRRWAAWWLDQDLHPSTRSSHHPREVS
jgi:hypothetical protein